MLIASSGIRLTVLALAAESNVGCSIRPCDIFCENILISVTFYSKNIFSMLDVRLIQMFRLHFV